MKFEFHDYLASFFNRRYFKVTSPKDVMIVIILSILPYNKCFMGLTF